MSSNVSSTGVLSHEMGITVIAPLVSTGEMIAKWDVTPVGVVANFSGAGTGRMNIKWGVRAVTYMPVVPAFISSGIGEMTANWLVSPIDALPPLESGPLLVRDATERMLVRDEP